MDVEANSAPFDLNLANAVLASSDSSISQEVAQIGKLDSAGAAFHAHCLYHDAELCYRTALNLRKAHNLRDLKYLENLHRLGVLSRLQQNFLDAEQMHLEAIDFVKTMFGPDHQRVADQKNYLAGIYYAWNRETDAAKIMNECLALYETIFGSDSLPVGLCHFALTLIYQKIGNTHESNKHFNAADEVLKRQVYSQEETIGEALLDMALASFRHHDVAAAETLFRHSIIMREEMLWPFHPLVPATLLKLGFLYEARGLYPKAKLCYESAIAKQQDAFGARHPMLIEALTRLADFHLQHGDSEIATELREQILSLQEEN